MQNNHFKLLVGILFLLSILRCGSNSVNELTLSLNDENGNSIEGVKVIYSCDFSDFTDDYHDGILYSKKNGNVELNYPISNYSHCRIFFHMKGYYPENLCLNGKYNFKTKDIFLTKGGAYLFEDAPGLSTKFTANDTSFHIAPLLKNYFERLSFENNQMYSKIHEKYSLKFLTKNEYHNLLKGELPELNFQKAKKNLLTKRDYFLLKENESDTYFIFKRSTIIDQRKFENLPEKELGYFYYIFSIEKMKSSNENCLFFDEKIFNDNLSVCKD